ncbi:SpaA isopeptide-forming pilin-related protein [Bifidobacterium pseudolongum]|uniref:SpaA isopeptide-forming pilin-related protein n=1 Tax=Bifidobacterium pseudolongum TaxID=1694 RepID=UPI003F8E0325
MQFKRLFAGVAAAATILGGLAIGAATATAADATANTITINGDVNGREFTAYLLGEYTNPVVSNGVVTSVDFNQSTAWNPSIATAAQTAAALDPATTIPDQYKGNELAWIASLSQTSDAARLRAFADALRAATSKPAPSTTVTGADGTAVISGLTPGYYLVTDGDGAPILVGTNIIADGTVYTTLNGATLATAFAKPTQPTKPGKEVAGDTQGTVSLGDVLTYTITGVIPGNPSGTELKMKFKDVASKGLTLPSTTDGFEVMIGEAVYTGYTLTQTIDANTKETTTEFDLGDVRAFAGQTVTITYEATVNEDALDTVNNTAYVYDPNTGQYVEEGTPVENKLYSFDFTKQDADGNPLAGAEFTISGDNIDEGYTDNGGVTTVTSGTDGKVTFKGLAAGTYTVQETKVPNGFLQNVKPKFTVTIDAEGKVTFGTDVWGLMNDGVVKNVKSVTQLPLTGAAGITMLIVVALLLGGAAALIGVRSHSLKRQLTA